VAIYFMTPDRNEEYWNIATSVKELDGNESNAATETGLSGSSMNVEALGVVKSA
jgi:hypothetical protein